MNHPWLLITMVAGLLLATGCSEQSAPTPQAEQTTDQHILKQQQQALDKAMQVNQQLMDAAQNQRQAIDENTQ